MKITKPINLDSHRIRVSIEDMIICRQRTHSNLIAFQDQGFLSISTYIVKLEAQMVKEELCPKKRAVYVHSIIYKKFYYTL